MGVAVLSGVIDGLNTRKTLGVNDSINSDNDNVESGTSTPLNLSGSNAMLEAKEACLPSEFICTVNRPESAKLLKKTFENLDGYGKNVKVTYGKGSNVHAVLNSDVVLLW